MSREKVYKLLKQLPKSKVTTYKELARAAGIHPRAVAVYMKTNRDTENVQCFRVISSDGSVGGYSGRDGVNGKIRLLKESGIEVRNGKIDGKYIHVF